MSFEFIKKLPTPAEIRKELPLPAELVKIKEERDAEIRDVLTGKSNKFLVIIGPCSADNEDSVCDYVNRLARVNEQVKDKLLPYLEQAMNERKIEMVFVMLTNIIEETTFLICAGEKANALIEEAFHVHKTGDYHILKEVVSRKKQLIPMFMSALQEQ